MHLTELVKHANGLDLGQNPLHQNIHIVVSFVPSYTDKDDKVLPYHWCAQAQSLLKCCSFSNRGKNPVDALWGLVRAMRGAELRKNDDPRTEPVYVIPSDIAL